MHLSHNMTARSATPAKQHCTTFQTLKHFCSTPHRHSHRVRTRSCCRRLRKVAEDCEHTSSVERTQVHLQTLKVKGEPFTMHSGKENFKKTPPCTLLEANSNQASLRLFSGPRPFRTPHPPCSRQAWQKSINQNISIATQNHWRVEPMKMGTEPLQEVSWPQCVNQIYR